MVKPPHLGDDVNTGLMWQVKYKDQHSKNSTGIRTMHGISNLNGSMQQKQDWLKPEAAVKSQM
ncbi:hypothetical protein HPP92_022260 [Vanilla planifolia]|uniref:Uncharacterized protein n=1 Tax=Vanilla planifolia TaxID=51239 RepID=A0A835UDC8_VANPL|nr:hypothetical protein HPP92_022260 [Vanilla planifolia]